MKLNFGLLGIALAQSGDDYERHDYSYDYGGDKHFGGFGGSQNYQFNNFGEKAIGLGTSHIQARRLSCWNSNSLRDMVMDGKFDNAIGSNDHYHHQYGYENTYDASTFSEFVGFGDQELAGHDIDISDDANSVRAVRPVKWGYQNNNPDAKYHYGHHVHDEDLAANVNRPYSRQLNAGSALFDAAGNVDDFRYSLRHAGCLYEAPDWWYEGTTFNKLRYLTYSLVDHVTGSEPAGSQSVATVVHWVHVFNAHIHIHQGAYCVGGADFANTDETCVNGDNAHQFAVVQANPTYEGLGFLNFIATYEDAYNPLVDTEEAGHRFKASFGGAGQYKNSGYWYLGKLGADAAAGDDWHLECNTNSCLNIDWGGATPRGLAISSFPHNELGEDFRFNVRTLHQMGDGKVRGALRAPDSGNIAYSYFFYGISKIVIVFPEYVARVNDCWQNSNFASCSEDDVHQVIVDQSSVQMTSSGQQVGGDIAYGNHQFMHLLTQSDTRCAAPGIGGTTFATTVANSCASWCDITGIMVNGHNAATQDEIDGIANFFCGDTFTMWGILSTYDELHNRQFGTIQEIWVQFMYAYSHATSFDTGAATSGFESPMNNVFFSAPNVLSVAGHCADAAHAKCAGYTRAQNVPYAGSDTDAKRWNLNADGLGLKTSQKGDGFWVDDYDV